MKVNRYLNGEKLCGKLPNLKISNEHICSLMTEIFDYIECEK